MANGRTIRVKPLPNGDGWQVLVSGARKSTHRKKSAAKRRAKREMRAADTLHVHKQTGAKQFTQKGPAA